MATIDVKDASGATVALEKPLPQVGLPLPRLGLSHVD
jgi:hypothetical protein